MVVDLSERRLITGRLPVIGTYRLLRQDIAEQYGGFYSAEEFDISGLLRRHAGLRFLELGRSCVLPPYRSKRTIELLWHGVWWYVREHHLDVMIGCASLEGIDTARLARPLSFLHHFARVPAPWHAAAHALRRIEMNRIAKSEIDIKAAWHELPPLIKGYLCVGAFVGDGAVIDRQFGTTDVLIILPISMKSFLRRSPPVDRLLFLTAVSVISRKSIPAWLSAATGQPFASTPVGVIAGQTAPRRKARDCR